MAIAKVILNGVTQMDVTQKSVTAGSMLSGTTALKNDGTDITGNIASKTSSDMTVSGATVTAPAGYYASNASKSVASGSAKTPATTITANPSISVNSSGLITATVSKTQSVTPTVSAGYVASGTAGTITVSGSGTSQLTTQAAQTIHPSTTDQTIASGKYLTGAQTIKAVTTTNLTAENIVSGVTVKVGDSTDDDCVASVTGTAATGANDFIITLTKNASTRMWEPDCTFAEAKAAYDAGKNIAFTTGSNMAVQWRYDSTEFYFAYGVAEMFSEASTHGYTWRYYEFSANGVELSYQGKEYSTSNATATPADVANGKVFYNASGYQTGTAPNDFVITLTKNASTRIYEPDCTFAEAKAAYDAGKNVAFKTSDMSPCAFGYDENENGFLYAVDNGRSGSNWNAVSQLIYLWTSTGVVLAQSGDLAYYTPNATATPADVASGKVFYNADGYQTGTASGGSDADFKAFIERSATNPTLPSDLTAIGAYAFYYYTNLALTSLPSGITSIGLRAFQACTNLALTSLPSGITSIGTYAFQACTNLALTSLPDGLTGLAPSAFQECSSLALTSLPSGITTIEMYAFYKCYAITISSLPDSVTYIGTSAFSQCNSMTSISCNGTITTMGNNAFTGNSTSPSQIAHASFPNMTVSSLSYAFGSTTSANACKLLEDADIGNTAAIAANAFANCYKLQTLILRKTGSICTLANVSAFNNTPIRGYNSLTGTIYVPSALIDTYKTATNWSTIYGEGHVTFAAIEGSEYEL